MDEINFLTFKSEVLIKDQVLKESLQEEFKEYQKEIISLTGKYLSKWLMQSGLCSRQYPAALCPSGKRA